MNKQRLGSSAHQVLGLPPDVDKPSNQPVAPRDGRTTGEQSGGMGQFLGNLTITLISVGMLLGSFLLSQMDASGTRPSATSVAQISPSPTVSLPTPTQPPPSASPTEPIPFPSSATETIIPPTFTPSPTSFSPLIPPSCSPPANWIAYTVRQGETLYGLAIRTGVTELVLMDANCLSTPTIYSDQQIYLPHTLYVSPTPRSCGPPLGWTPWYTVRPGDTLFSLNQRFGVGIEAIRNANCLPGYTIFTGQLLYLPPVSPTATHTPTLFPSPTYTATEILPTLTQTPTPTPTDLPSITPLPTLTATAIFTVTATHTPVPTPAPTETPVLEFTSTPTPTGSPAPTSTPTSTPATPTPTPTAAPILTPTATTVPTAIPTPTATPTLSSG